jgi:hypothetical protein
VKQFNLRLIVHALQERRARLSILARLPDDGFPQRMIAANQVFVPLVKPLQQSEAWHLRPLLSRPIAFRTSQHKIPHAIQVATYPVLLECVWKEMVNVSEKW